MKNIWPIGIAIFFGFMCCMIILTVYVSMKYKPDYDNAYFSTRQVVDKDINDILIAQNTLESKYKFYVFNNKNAILLMRKANRKSSALYLPQKAIMYFKIVDAKDKIIKGKSVRVYITRFADSSADKDIGELKQQNNIFTSPEIAFEKGEWKMLVEFSVDDKKAYFEQRIIIGQEPPEPKPKKKPNYVINHNLA